MNDDLSQVLACTDFENVEQAQDCLTGIQAMGIPSDLFQTFLQQLCDVLPQVAEPNRVLTSLHRFLEASRSPQSCLSMLERDPGSLAPLLNLFSTSQYLADLLIYDPDAFDLVRLTDGQPVARSVLQDEILSAVQSANDLKAVRQVLREYRRRETLRIAYGDFVNQQSVDIVVQQISILAECIVEAALAAASTELHRRGRPVPPHADGQPIAFTVLALGKLGGQELNYSSDIDLIFLRESWRAPAKRTNTGIRESHVQEYFERLAQLVVKILGDSTPLGIAYRVDLRLRPHGKNGPLVVSFSEAVGYYDSLGRTWERQAFVKARCIAGDMELGRNLLQELEPWIYRRYPMRADITGLIALKRRIEYHSNPNLAPSNEYTSDEMLGADLKLGFGGIRDIEYAIQFLQLLHGPDQPKVRCASTLEAICQLQAAGCITAHEQEVLEANYRFLRQVEHYLQIMFNLQTHSLPTNSKEFENLATRIETEAGSPLEAAERLFVRLRDSTQSNRRILNHLLHHAFAEHDAEEQILAHAESDLILDPDPSPDVVQKTLEKFGFRDCSAAFRHLQELAVESIRFLSTRRSRHFLAAIAPELLSAIAATPDPDATLISLANVSASLGGKAVLWELFSTHPPSMELCIRLCAASPYLTGILTGNPGMIDELLDSLMLGHLPNHQEMAQELDALCKGAAEIGPMLHSFKNSMHLSIGVHDVLGKASIGETHSALSDVAEVCMEQVIHHEFHRLVHKLGVPTTLHRNEAQESAQTDEQPNPSSSQRVQQVYPAELVVLAVGKLGGREPNYHSDIDLIFLFDGEGDTQSLVPNRRFEPTTNRHFFNQLCQRVIHSVTRAGSTGKLYDLDVRLRPLGRSGQLAISIGDFCDYFESGAGQIWERQALCKARPIWGAPSAKSYAMQSIRHVLASIDWAPQHAQSIFEHRMQLQQGASESNLKRGVGGTMDIEFLVQLLQLANVRTHPDILTPGTVDAIRLLQEKGLIEQSTAHELNHHYQFLRSVESGIRLMNLSARHELPQNNHELDQLAFLLKSRNRIAVSPDQLVPNCDQVRSQCRTIFNSVFAPWLAEETEPGSDAV